jgi:hypothetical protein
MDYQLTVKCGADDLGTKCVPVGRVKRLSIIYLQVGRQGQHKQTVYGRN